MLEMEMKQAELVVDFGKKKTKKKQHSSFSLENLRGEHIA